MSDKNVSMDEEMSKHPHPLIVIDTETTGISDTAEIVEFAWVRITRLEEPGSDEFGSFLVRPTCPIDPGATRTHGLTDADVAGMPSAAHYREFVRELLRDDIVCAHNAQFDLGMVQRAWPGTGGSRGVICTLRTSWQVWPQLPNYRLQNLSHLLTLPEHPAQCSLPSHRALRDALDAAMLLRAIPWHDTAQLCALSWPLHLLKLVHFGKHKGRRWDQVPKDYLQWVVENWDDKLVRFTALHHLNLTGPHPC